MEIFVTLLAGTAGGLLGRKFKLPVGAMTGSLLAVIGVKLIFDCGYMPSQTKVMLQILSGALIGSRVRKSDVLSLKKMWLPAIVLVVGMIIMNLTSAFVMNALSHLDYVTAYFASAPGGLQDMALISSDFGADTLVVSICQVCRVLFILIAYPWLYRLIHTRKLYPQNISEISVEKRPEITGQVNHQESKTVSFCATVLAAALGGMLLRYMGVTAGALLGALVATAVLNVTTETAYIPGTVKIGLQILTGAYVGMQVSRNTVQSIAGVLMPMVIMLLGTTVLIYLLALVIQRVSKQDFMTCLLICTPGGLQEMCLLADDMDCDAPKIVLMHTVRIIIVVSLCPIVLTLLQRCLGM